MTSPVPDCKYKANHDAHTVTVVYVSQTDIKWFNASPCLFMSQ